MDFKSKADPAHGGLERKDREILAQTLSALANSMGGAVIYGIDCRVNDDGVDAAADIKAIQGIRRFASEVTANIANLVLPRLEGVAVDLIEKPDASDTGILVISVERSERRPHRSEAAGDKRYYKRSGSNTVQMEHFDVEDAFHRQSVAKLEFDTPIPFEAGSSNNTHHYHLAFFLRNVSNLTAKFPFVEVECLQGGVIWQYGIDGNGTFPLKPMSSIIPQAVSRMMASLSSSFMARYSDNLVVSQACAMIAHKNRRTDPVNSRIDDPISATEAKDKIACVLDELWIGALKLITGIRWKQSREDRR